MKIEANKKDFKKIEANKKDLFDRLKVMDTE